jgi:hypothetical protein
LRTTPWRVCLLHSVSSTTPIFNQTFIASRRREHGLPMKFRKMLEHL